MISRNIVSVKRKMNATWHVLKPRMGTYALRGMVLGLLALAVSQKQLSLHISLQPATLYPLSVDAERLLNFKTKSFENEQIAAILPLSSSENEGAAELNLANEATAVSAALTPEQQANAAQYSNLGFVLNPDFAAKKGIDPKVVTYKKQKCADYIEKYLNIAKEEANLYNIPVAITLAQGLLESNAGDSKLASKENNHFGIKCHNKCTGCKCANYTDDSVYDMFRVFESPWYSFREHSKLLQNKRYKHLLQLSRTDYRNWAYGLQAAGYATDKKYAEKLIKIVEMLSLNRYDAI